MGRALRKVKGLGYILWQSRHMVYHVMLGLLWAWYLRETWGEFNFTWIITAVVGSVFPDIEHIYYFLGYGRKDAYAKKVLDLFKGHHFRELFQFVATGHKYNTSLAYHNLYTVFIFVVVSFGASIIDWQVGVVFFGAMVSHYLFDICDDIVQLGGLNPNWKRWGRPRK